MSQPRITEKTRTNPELELVEDSGRGSSELEEEVRPSTISPYLVWVECPKSLLRGHACVACFVDI